MPEAWSKKDERMYEHIRKSERQRGRSERDAKRIAAAKVNDQRRQEGRTKSGKQATSGTGNPATALEERSKQQLVNRARELSIHGRSTMTKRELVRAIRDRE
jgi:hypothetical protein